MAQMQVGRTLNAGNICVCASPILVQDGVCGAFTKRLAETAGAMKAVEKVEAHIADAVKKGAKVVLGGKRAAQGGSFFEPTVLTDVTTDIVITKETIGPVAPLYRFKTEDEATKMANDTEFRLAAYYDAVFERLGDAPNAANVAAVEIGGSSGSDTSARTDHHAITIIALYSRRLSGLWRAQNCDRRSCRCLIST